MWLLMRVGGIELLHHPDRGTVTIEITEATVMGLYVSGCAFLIGGIALGCVIWQVDRTRPRNQSPLCITLLFSPPTPPPGPTPRPSPVRDHDDHQDNTNTNTQTNTNRAQTSTQAKQHQHKHKRQTRAIVPMSPTPKRAPVPTHTNTNADRRR